MVVDVGTPTPYINAVTATMDGGTAKNGNVWYEVGFNTSFPATGLPMGTTFTSAASATTTFTLLPANGNNAALFDAGHSTGTLTFTTPAQYSKLSFLTSTGAGSGTLQITVNYADATPSTVEGTIGSADWFGGSSTAIVANGRVDDANSLNDVNSGNPRLYQMDLTLSALAASHPISSVDINWSGSGHTAVFAISGDLVPVPETSHVLLAAVGGLALVGFARRRLFAAA